MSKTLPYDHPDYEFPKEVHNLLVASLAAHVQLSAMADTKASILMGGTFFVFTLAVGQVSGSTASIASALPLIVLGAFSFAATVLSVMAVMPKIKLPRGANPNFLFFGVFSTMEEPAFVDHMIGVLRNEETAYRAMARDLYQNGVVLQRKKYYFLTRAYQFLLTGLVLTLVTFMAQIVFGPLLRGAG